MGAPWGNRKGNKKEEQRGETHGIGVLAVQLEVLNIQLSVLKVSYK